MFNPPKTVDEAMAYRYRVWGGSPKGTRYRVGYCAYEVPEGGRSPLFHQCNRKNGKGPDGLYCGIHAKYFKQEGE